MASSHTRHAAFGFLGLITVASVSGHAADQRSLADTYPTRPIRMLVPFTPAGTTDVVARALAQRMQEHMGQQVVVDNRPGASGAIAAETGETAELSTTGGTSDGRFIAKVCEQVVEFGPVNATIHKIDEHVAVDAIEPLKNIYRRTLEALLA